MFVALSLAARSPSLRLTLLLAAAMLAGCAGTGRNDPARAQAVAELSRRVEALEAQAARARALEELVAELLARLEGAPAKPRRPASPNPELTYAVPVDGNPSSGSADALVTIVQGYEYACYYCFRVRATLRELAAKYGADLRVVYKPFVVHPEVATATALAACAAHEQGRFAQLDELMWTKVYATESYDDDDCWQSSAGCPILSGLAKEAGLDVVRWKRDMAGSCRETVSADGQLLRKLGMTGTPGFFINGRWLSGAQPLAAFTAIIDEELAKARGRVAAGTGRASYYKTWVLDKGAKPAQ